jgi:hypothetical protein
VHVVVREVKNMNNEERKIMQQAEVKEYLELEMFDGRLKGLPREYVFRMMVNVYLGIFWCIVRDTTEKSKVQQSWSEKL